MTVTRTTLIRSAALAAVAAGLIFIGVQIGHPHSDVTAVTTTEWAVRNSLKVVMTVLALAGITGMYLRQVRQTGLLGLVGYLVFGAGYLVLMSTAFVSAVVLPAIAGTDPGYVDDVLAAATNGSAVGDIGLMQAALSVTGITFLGGGLIFGIALYRARVLARWAAALLAVASLLTASLAVLPDAFFRFLAFPNSIAMIGLGYSLWVSTRVAATTAVGASPRTPASAR
ncbi:hypothetical protein [Georgenia muralis]|uniref:DUF4386 family protein n=1 Tax=Georgenia muralis TaxID=154117 RepID=A0A3N4Z7P1_9MICO|nr:hypothetical protein [Georgenia muralis]RPF28323.1 hypothetical protein EDD32_2846 [Georgenia muralis]